MSQPPTYNRQFNFTNYQTVNPSTPLPAVSVDAELNSAKQTLDAILANLKLIQRDDGKIANASVGLDQLSAQVLVGFNVPTVWVTAAAYTTASTAFHGSAFYRCLVAHTSGVFATDLAAAKWELIVDLSTITTVSASQIAITPAGGVSAIDVQQAIYDLDTGKAATSHTHVAAAISDSTALGRSLLTAASTDAALAAIDAWSTGDVKLTLKTVPDTSWVMADDGTIGSAASGATNRANADTAALYTLLWTNVADGYAPVSTGRGASAAADFAANKTIGLTKMLGRSLAVAGTGSSLTARALGYTVGEETHILTTPEIPAHTHTATVTDPGHFHTTTAVPAPGVSPVTVGGGQLSASPASPIASDTKTTSITVANANAGGDGAHNNMQPTSFLNVMIKL